VRLGSEKQGKRRTFHIFPVALLVPFHLSFDGGTQRKGLDMGWTDIPLRGRPLSSFILPYKPTKLLANVFVGKPLSHEFVKGERV